MLDMWTHNVLCYNSQNKRSGIKSWLWIWRDRNRYVNIHGWYFSSWTTREGKKKNNEMCKNGSGKHSNELFLCRSIYRKYWTEYFPSEEFITSQKKEEKLLRISKLGKIVVQEFGKKVLDLLLCQMMNIVKTLTRKSTVLSVSFLMT